MSREGPGTCLERHFERRRFDQHLTASTPSDVDLRQLRLIGHGDGMQCTKEDKRVAVLASRDVEPQAGAAVHVGLRLLVDLKRKLKGSMTLLVFSWWRGRWAKRAWSGVMKPGTAPHAQATPWQFTEYGRTVQCELGERDASPRVSHTSTGALPSRSRLTRIP